MSAQPISHVSLPARKRAHLSLDYFTRLPRTVPAGKIVAHNSFSHAGRTRRLGMRGFRAWAAALDARYVPCDCGWAPHLGVHFRVDRNAARKRGER